MLPNCPVGQESAEGLARCFVFEISHKEAIICWSKLWSHLKALLGEGPLPNFFTQLFVWFRYLWVGVMRAMVPCWMLSGELALLSCREDSSIVQLITWHVISLKIRVQKSKRGWTREKAQSFWNVILKEISYQYFHILFIRSESQ